MSSTSASPIYMPSPVSAVMLTWCVTHTSNVPAGIRFKTARNCVIWAFLVRDSTKKRIERGPYLVTAKRQICCVLAAAPGAGLDRAGFPATGCEPLPNALGMGAPFAAEIALCDALVQSKAQGVANARSGGRMAHKHHTGASVQSRLQRASDCACASQGRANKVPVKCRLCMQV